MLQPVFREGVDKGVRDYVAKNFEILVGDILSADDGAAKKRAVAKFKKLIEGTSQAYVAAAEIVES